MIVLESHIFDHFFVRILGVYNRHMCKICKRTIENFSTVTPLN